MRLALVALALTVPGASAAGTPAPPKAGQTAAPAPLCRHDLKVRPARIRDAPRVKRLGELPSGDLTLTVVNRVGNCIEPVTVRQGYGAMSDGPAR
ncbi:MAG TPA: hypothetical protein VEA61_03380 [Allosphingosinicella sp.]|nr:hypothetical protein [Allosphingosinicella sp.]